MPHAPRTVQGLWSLAAAVAASLLILMAPQRAHADPCAGTTVTPAAPSGSTIDCNGSTTTIDITGHLGKAPYELTANQQAQNTNGTSVLTVTGTGAVVINNSGAAGTFGGFDFADNSGGVTVNNAAVTGNWSFSGTATTFGSGNDVINNAGLLLPTSMGNEDLVAGSQVGQNHVPYVVHETTVDFGAGHNVINNSGTLLIGDARFAMGTGGGGGQSNIGNPGISQNSRRVPSQLNLQNLQEFNNSGTIVLGGWVYQGGKLSNQDDPNHIVNQPFWIGDAVGEATCRSILVGNGLLNPPADGFSCVGAGQGPEGAMQDTDRNIDAVLSMPGAAFTGSGNSTILMDALFSAGIAQRNCVERAGEDQHFALPGADCVDLSGGSAAGSTQIIVRDVIPGDQGASNPDGIVLIDVSGGQSSQDAFTLSPLSDHYTPSAGGAIDKGMFLFPLVYDEGTQQHKLVSIASERALQMPLLVQSAQAISRAADGVWFDRQAALREVADAADRGGFWGQIAQVSASRDVTQTESAYGQHFSLGNDFDQDTTIIAAGRDFVFGSTPARSGLFGASVGYVYSNLNFDSAQARAGSNFDGVTAGIHGGYQAGNGFVDAAISYAYLDMDHDIPSLDLFPDGTVLSTKVQTLGARVEGGWRFALSDALHIEPLATLSWVRADFEKMNVPSADPSRPGNTVFGNDEPSSLRGALGARLGFDQRFQSMRVNYTVTGRVWKEFGGSTDVLLQSNGPDVTVSDDFDTTLGELVAGISLSNASGGISGFLNGDGTFGSGYTSLGVQAGLRYQW